jgi:cell division septal protein FtsQ
MPKLSPVIWRVIFFLMLLGAAAYLAFFSSVFEVKDVIIEGNELLSQAQIADAVPRGENIFLLDTDNLKSQIKEQVPEIKDMEIYRGIPNALKVVVLENDKAMIWESQGRKYLVNSQGVAYMDVTEIAGQFADLPRVVDSDNLVVKLNKRIVMPSFVAFIKNVSSNIKSGVNLEPDYFEVVETTVDVRLHTKSNYYVKFDTMRSSTKQLDDLKRVLVGKAPTINEYVDLRIPGWAYYK